MSHSPLWLRQPKTKKYFILPCHIGINIIGKIFKYLKYIGKKYFVLRRPIFLWFLNPFALHNSNFGTELPFARVRCCGLDVWIIATVECWPRTISSGAGCCVEGPDNDSLKQRSNQITPLPNWKLQQYNRGNSNFLIKETLSWIGYYSVSKNTQTEYIDDKLTFTISLTFHSRESIDANAII